ncbi:MAG: nitrilase-related carbon-nitrogen hydrolase [Halarsenatibacteraceae bacterium]
MRVTTSVPGPTYNSLAAKALKYNTYIHGGTIVEKANGNLYNTALFISPKGELLAKYRKIHFFIYPVSVKKIRKQFPTLKDKKL